ncbi:MAG TPA: hypothetical protein VLA05_05140 [Coriobacteriia bacterium]|nr:hypothetical protein [Coriobacteriia bacterium]
MHYYDDELTVYGLVRNLFAASATVCLLWGLQRMARGTILKARVKAYTELCDAYTPEEREALIHKIKTESLHS